jgi:hypothetical protein
MKLRLLILNCLELISIYRWCCLYFNVIFNITFILIYLLNRIAFKILIYHSILINIVILVLLFKLFFISNIFILLFLFINILLIILKMNGLTCFICVLLLKILWIILRLITVCRFSWSKMSTAFSFLSILNLYFHLSRF